MPSPGNADGIEATDCRRSSPSTEPRTAAVAYRPDSGVSFDASCTSQPAVAPSGAWSVSASSRVITDPSPSRPTSWKSMRGGASSVVLRSMGSARRPPASNVSVLPEQPLLEMHSTKKP